jgi:hypothetical protein
MRRAQHALVRLPLLSLSRTGVHMDIAEGTGALYLGGLLPKFLACFAVRPVRK